jgi:hypothetical protein
MRRSMAVVAALVMLAALPATAVAAPPANDLPGGALPIAAVPSSFTQPTTEATVTSADDVGCGSGGQDQASVWYRITPATSMGVLIDATASSYRVGVNVYETEPTPDGLRACFDGFAGFASLTAGLTYYVMFADIDGGANGGQLSVSLSIAPPPIAITFTTSPVVKIADKGLSASVSGTMTCDRPASFAGVDVNAAQRVGKYQVRFFGGAAVDCGPEPSPWLAELFSSNGRLAGGKITVELHFFACDAVGQCTDADATFTSRTRQ